MWCSELALAWKENCFVSDCVTQHIPTSPASPPLFHLFSPSLPMAATTDSAPQISNLSIHSRNNPIDLTNDDEELAPPQYHSPRSKRARPDVLDSRLTTDQYPPPSRYSTDSPPTTFSTHSTSSTPNSDYFPLRPESSTNPHMNSSSAFMDPYRPSFVGPNLPLLMDKYPPPRPQYPHVPQYPQQPPPPAQYMQRNTPAPPAVRQLLPPLSTPNSGRQVIDLTDSPSPPPSAAHNVPPGLTPINPDDPPKTPVCIGQLSVNALVLYPIAYLMPRDPSQECEWAAVRLQYEHNPHRVGNSETIHIRTPSDRTPNGDIILGDNFAVVEQKVATSLGGMLGKGLIRLEAKIRRGKPNVCAFPPNTLTHARLTTLLVSFRSYPFRC